LTKSQLCLTCQRRYFTQEDVSGWTLSSMMKVSCYLLFKPFIFFGIT
jgi:hypothetical protein